VSKLFVLSWPGLLLSEKQIPQVVVILGRGEGPKEASEKVVLFVRQAL
jgi:hypothetical protein